MKNTFKNRTISIPIDIDSEIIKMAEIENRSISNMISRLIETGLEERWERDT